MNQQIALADDLEDRSPGIAKLRRNARREWRILQRWAIQCAQRKQIAQAEQLSGIEDVALGERRTLGHVIGA